MSQDSSAEQPSPQAEPLIALVVHEVKNQLAWLVDRAENQGDVEAQRVALGAADHLTGLLLWLRQREDALPLNIDAWSIAEVLEDLAEDQRQLYHLSPVVDVAEAPETWFFDRWLITLVLRNALENAHRHGRPPLRMEAREVGDNLVILVRDAGKGFPAELLAGKPVVAARRGSSSTGLGLLLSRAIAEAHENAGRRGRLVLRNDPGAVFELYLPR